MFFATIVIFLLLKTILYTSQVMHLWLTDLFWEINKRNSSQISFAIFEMQFCWKSDIFRNWTKMQFGYFELKLPKCINTFYVLFHQDFRHLLFSIWMGNLKKLHSMIFLLSNLWEKKVEAFLFHVVLLCTTFKTGIENFFFAFAGLRKGKGPKFLVNMHRYWTCIAFAVLGEIAQKDRSS